MKVKQMPEAMKSPQVHAEGYWLSHEEGHYFDPSLAQELTLLLHGKSVCDFGCGLGKYVNWLRKVGFEADGYDGNPNTGVLTKGVCRSLNLAERFRLERQYDAVICLEVGEHIPKQLESVFLDNLVSHAKEMIVLSWAIPGQEGDGHVNCRSSSYVIYQLFKRGFRLQPRWTALLRANCSLYWFKNTLMVFRKSRVRWWSMAERKAAGYIVSADIERLKRNNRSNSSLISALIGKSVRTLSPAKDGAAKTINILRLFWYDIMMSFPRRKTPVIIPTERTVGGTHFFPVCFTCGKHFKFVRLALFSLGRCAPPIKEINVYMDKGDPLSDVECQLLRSESPYPVKFHQTAYAMSWGGPNVILNELYGFQDMASGMETKDVLMKFDSDVLFISDAIFKLIESIDAGAIGTQPYYERSDYLQGGCYFVRAKELRTVLRRSIAVKMLAFSKNNFSDIPEDAFISSLLLQCRAKITYDEFLYFDSTFVTPGVDQRQLEDRLQAVPQTASIIHFEGDKLNKGDKSNMSRVAECFFQSLPSVSNPYQ
jgi:Methyltransferase domain